MHQQQHERTASVSRCRKIHFFLLCQRMLWLACTWWVWLLMQQVVKGVVQLLLNKVIDNTGGRRTKTTFTASFGEISSSYNSFYLITASSPIMRRTKMVIEDDNKGATGVSWCCRPLCRADTFVWLPKIAAKPMKCTRLISFGRVNSQLVLRQDCTLLNSSHGGTGRPGCLLTH